MYRKYCIGRTKKNTSRDMGKVKLKEIKLNTAANSPRFKVQAKGDALFYAPRMTTIAEVNY